MRRAPTPVAVPPSVAVLGPFVVAGLLGPAEVHLATTFARLCPDEPDEVLLALAMAARAPRLGHVCVRLDELPEQVAEPDRADGADTGSVVGTTAPADLADPAESARATDPLGDALPWPDPASWAAILEASPLVARAGDHDRRPLRPLVWDAGRLYLQRYHHDELAVVADLTRRSGGAGPSTDPGTPSPDSPDSGDSGMTGVSPDALEAALDAVFGPDDPADPDRQRRAARIALRGGVSVIAGGPGTGKTRTVARTLAVAATLAARTGRRREVALAAPTGKAAARMTEALHAAVGDAEADGVLDPGVAADLRSVTAVTLHRLLEHRPGVGFRRHRDDPLPHDLVVVDETSMVSLPLMAALLDAVRPEATVVLVGDPHQLASIEAGTVMADLVGPAGVEDGGGADRAVGVPGDSGGLADRRSPGGDAPHGGRDRAVGVLSGRVTVLTRSRRFGAGSGIAELAGAVRRGDADAAVALLGEGRHDIAWIPDPTDPTLDALLAELVDAGVEVVGHATAGRPEEALAEATRVKVLAATRLGPLGVHDWTARIEAGVAASVPGFRSDRRWSAGRPVIVTANDAPNRLTNGDVGVVVRRGGTHAVAFPGPDGVRFVSPARLDRVETWWATTIHKSQGSEFDHAVVSLARPGSPILTRELLYTAVTRARQRVTVVAGEAAVRAAVTRPIRRASGLCERLWSEP